MFKRDILHMFQCAFKLFFGKKSQTRIFSRKRHLNALWMHTGSASRASRCTLEAQLSIHSASGCLDALPVCIHIAVLTKMHLPLPLPTGQDATHQ